MSAKNWIAINSAAIGVQFSMFFAGKGSALLAVALFCSTVGLVMAFSQESSK